MIIGMKNSLLGLGLGLDLDNTMIYLDLIMTVMLPQPLHDLKHYSRKKPKKKYESLDDVGSEISIFI
jgi:hypothetical protein